MNTAAPAKIGMASSHSTRSRAAGVKNCVARSLLLGVFLATLLPCLGVAPAAWATDISVRATLDQHQVNVGAAVTLTIEAAGAQNVPAPAVSAPAGLSIHYLGPATQVSIVNGQVTASVRHRYTVIPLAAGTFTLGPFALSYGGKVYKTGSVRLGVSAAGRIPAPKQSGGTARGRELTLTLETSKNEAYVQEQIPVTVTLAIGNARVEDVRYPALSHEGFAAEDFRQPTQARELHAGRTVQVVRFRTNVVPLRPGPLVLGPAEMQMSVLQRRRRQRDIFDRFFGNDFFGGDLFAERQPVTLRSDTIALKVRPLPSAGKPNDFSGAVGQFHLEATVKPTHLRAGDPITLSMRVSGGGSFASVSAPQLDAGTDFKVYPPQVSSSAAGEKVFEQVLIPEHSHVRAIPEIRFSFFNPAAGAYETARTGPFPITVEAALQPQAPKVVQAPAGEERPRQAERLGRDIVYIKETPGSLTPRGQRFYRSVWFLSLQLVPLLIYVAATWRARRRQQLHADPRYARFRRAGHEARAALAAARTALRRGDMARFDDTLSRTVQEYLAAKLDLPLGAVELHRVAEKLGRDGSPGAVVHQVEQLFQLLEQVRYAPTAFGDSERERALHMASRVVTALERRRHRVRWRGSAVIVLVLSGILSANAAPFHPAAAFYEANKLYGDGNFAQAAAGYEAIAAAGIESAAVYYNLGNAYMKSGAPGLAILNYERARRLAPRDPDIRTNLQFAREEQDIQVDVPLWQRFAFVLGERCTTGELAALNSLAYTLVLLALSARALWPAAGYVAARVAAGALVLLLIAAPSLGYRIAEYEVTDAAVVTQQGQVPVRFEPSADGTTYFIAREGALLRIVAEREGWSEIERSDGRRGWIERQALRRVRL